MLALTLLALGQPPAAPAATAVLTGEEIARPALPEPPAAEGRFDLLIGAPLALRYLHPLRGPVWGEVGGGVYLFVPDFFAGLRYDLGLHHGPRDSFLVRPGVQAHLFASRYIAGGVAAGVSADVELMWLRRWRDGSVGNLGLKFGVIPTFDNWIPVLPVFGVVVGF